MNLSDIYARADELDRVDPSLVALSRCLTDLILDETSEEDAGPIQHEADLALLVGAPPRT